MVVIAVVVMITVMVAVAAFPASFFQLLAFLPRLLAVLAVTLDGLV
jgi:hypothetical protein